MLHTRLAKTGFGHPTAAIFARVIKAALRFDQYIKTHQQSEGVLTPFIVF